ncbi:MAG TPA: YihY/virulence factor BrkB family protein [Casimicrobiaceae bacterium]|nr:YihY/virulence factor BrkB family protein [Casimicrobiaceae bacterium]
MPGFGTPASYVLRHPGAFAIRVLRSFRANQGYLLAGAVAYNTLLSILPLLILILIALANFVEQSALVATLGRYLEWIVPGQSHAIMGELALFLEHRHVVGWVLVVTLLFFSSLAFTVLENAMSVIFYHRVAVRRRPVLVSALIPFIWILFLGIGALIVTFVSGALQAMSRESVGFLGRTWSLVGVSGFLVYLIGVVGEIIVLTSIYMVMPAGRPSWRHALIGGFIAGLLWEFTRHVLVWYFSTISQVRIVYGSLTTAIVVLLSLEIAAMVLLLGAQVIAEYERLGAGDARDAPEPLRTD